MPDINTIDPVTETPAKSLSISPSPTNSVVSLGLGLLFEGLVELQSNPAVNSITHTRNQFIQGLMELAADIKTLYDTGGVDGEARTIEELREILNPEGAQ